MRNEAILAIDNTGEPVLGHVLIVEQAKEGPCSYRRGKRSEGLPVLKDRDLDSDDPILRILAEPDIGNED